MNLSKQKHLLFFTALIVLFLLFEYYILGVTPNPETQRYKMWFATGPHSPFKLDNSLLWLSQFNFGTPRLGNPLLIDYSPLSYFGLLIKEPYVGLATWTISLFLGIWGGFKLFQHFSNNSIIAFTSGVCFSLSGVMIISALIGLTMEQIPCTTWTLYFLVKYIKTNNLKFLFTSALIHALHFFMSAGFPTWFYLSAIISFYIFGVEIFKMIENKDKVIIKSTLLNILKNQFIYFGLLFSFVAIILLPIIEMMPYVSHRHLEIGDPVYRYAGRFNPSEFFLFPFLFPGIYKTGNQFESFVNLSYIGYMPLFFSLLWLKNNSRKILQIVIITLCVIIFAATSLPPVDTLLRLIPPLTETRLSSMWMFCWNFVFLYIMILSLEKVGGEIKLIDALKLSWQCLIVIFLILMFLYFGHLLKFDFGFNINLPFFNGKSYPTPPHHLINYEYWDWIESLRPVVVSIFLTLTLLLTVKSLISYRTMLLAIAFISILDISSWVGNRTLNYTKWVDNRTINNTDQHDIQLDIQYRNNMQHLEKFEGFQPPELGKGRAIFFGKPDDENKRYKFLAYKQHYESAHPATSLPTKRGFKMSVLLGWKESEMIDAGHTYNKITLKEFLLSEKLQLARSLNIKYFFSNKPILETYISEFNLKEIMIDKKIGMYLYEDLNALPRVIGYGKIHSVDNQNKAFELISKNQDITLSEAVVEIKTIDKNRKLPNITLNQDNLKILSYKPTKIVVESNFKENSFIVFSDIAYPGWSATIDNTAEKIYPSNIVGKGIFVDSGYHKIVFNYYPKYYFFGIILSIFGVFSFLIYWFVVSRKLMI